MFKIDSPGATINNLFTEGNPSLGIPATEVSDEWLNDVQGSLVEVIEGEGIALVKGDDLQLQAAILSMIGSGGSQTKLDPLLNNTVDQVITNLIFDKTLIKAAIIFVDIHRETDSSNVQETAVWMATHDSKDDLWRVSAILSAFDDSGATVNIVSASGQLRISTDNLTGTNYAAQLRIMGVMRFDL